MSASDGTDLDARVTTGHTVTAGILLTWVPATLVLRKSQPNFERGYRHSDLISLYPLYADNGHPEERVLLYVSPYHGGLLSVILQLVPVPNPDHSGLRRRMFSVEGERRKELASCGITNHVKFESRCRESTVDSELGCDLK